MEAALVLALGTPNFALFKADSGFEDEDQLVKMFA